MTQVNDNEQWIGLVQRLRDIAKIKGISINEIAEVTGTHRSSVSRFFSCKFKPTISTCQEVAAVLNVDVTLQDNDSVQLRKKFRKAGPAKKIYNLKIDPTLSKEVVTTHVITHDISNYIDVESASEEDILKLQQADANLVIEQFEPGINSLASNGILNINYYTLKDHYYAIHVDKFDPVTYETLPSILIIVDQIEPLINKVKEFTLINY